MDIPTFLFLILILGTVPVGGVWLGVLYLRFRLRKQELPYWTMSWRVGWHILAFSLVTWMCFPQSAIRVFCIFAWSIAYIFWFVVLCQWRACPEAGEKTYAN
jgi:hypothetical protein